MNNTIHDKSVNIQFYLLQSESLFCHEVLVTSNTKYVRLLLTGWKKTDLFWNVEIFVCVVHVIIFDIPDKISKIWRTTYAGGNCSRSEKIKFISIV